MEQPPENQGPQREPYNEWALEILEELKQEAVRPWLHGLGQHIYETYGDTWAGVEALIRILQQLLFIHFRIGCQHSRIGIYPQRRRNGASRS
uniref:Protein Vpr n=1 Tax=Human immunodeficiency virus type 1 TaxID=11676 RepID=G9IPW2_HV1|nr:vpr protein [Human immunodeficiency virus 1]